MKITEIKTFTPFNGSRHCFLVKVETDTEIYGIGEGGLTWMEPEMVAAAERLRELLVGQDPLNIDRLWQLMVRQAFFPASGATMSAVSAIDIALHDIKGKAWRVPVYQLLGGRSRERVPLYCHVGLPEGEPQIEAIQRRIEGGFTVLRFSPHAKPPVYDPPSAVESCIEKWLEAHGLIEGRARLAFDCHTEWSPNESLQFCKAIEHTRPYFIEDPVRAEYPESVRSFRQRTSCPLAIGEHFDHKARFARLIEEELIDFARIDVCNVGGLTEALKVAHLAETHYVQVIPHNPLGPVCTAATMHLCTAIDNFAVQEGGGIGMLTEVFPDQYRDREGCLYPEDRPGLGLTFDEGAAVRAVKDEGQQLFGPPLLQRPDGSFTNW